MSSKKKIVVKQVINSGLILEPPAVEDYHAEKLFGAVRRDFVGTSSPLKEPPIIFPDGIGWLQVAKDYGLPEIQFNRKFDTSSCTVFSIAKALCYYLFKVYGIRTTVSEMYNAWYARVKPRRGTTIRRGMESFRKHGWVKDKYYPFTAKTTLEEYFREPPKKIQILAHKKLTEWNFHWEVIPKHLPAIFEAYKRTPVVLTGFAWASYYGEGIYYDYDNPPNHAFLGLQPSPRGNNLVDDTYPKNFKYISPEALTRDELIKELHKSYKYGSAHRCWLTPTEETRKTLLNFIINMFKKISRDIHGGFWFLKKVNGKVHKQKITDWVGMLGAIIDEVGVEKNNLTDEELAKIPDYQFFGK